MKRVFSAIAISTILLLASCGGGGGGGGSGPANVNLNVDPSKIDAGDNMTVTIDISDVADNGIVLKIRTPVGLDYVTDSGYLTVEDVPLNLDPAFYKTDTKFNYLVYFVDRNLFGDGNSGQFIVTYQGTAAVASGTVDVDTDEINPSLTESQQFKVSDPKFSAEDSQKIVVKN